MCGTVIGHQTGEKEEIFSVHAAEFFLLRSPNILLLFISSVSSSTKTFAQPLDFKPFCQQDKINSYFCSHIIHVRYHCGGWSEELNSRILLLAYMVYL
jgi:hypothetical protein